MPRTANTQHATRNTKQIASLLLTWFAKNARDRPWRRTRDPYGIWVSEIMLQQTQVKTVMPYWDRWMRELPTIASLAKASPAKIHKLWEGLGYYTRVRNLQKAAQFIEQSHRGKFPEKFDDVLALSGIGRYTAGAICSIAFNQPTPILDGNVIRVLTRVFGIKENPRGKSANPHLWNLAEQLVIHASRFTFHAHPCSHLNQSLMELGALICTPREPKCLVCPISKHCFAFQNNRVSGFPNLEKRAAPMMICSGPMQLWNLPIRGDPHQSNFAPIRKTRGGTIASGRRNAIESTSSAINREIILERAKG